MPDKRSAFVRLAEKRTLAVMDKVRILSNLSNRNLYEYDDDDVNEIFGAIEEEIRLARNKFATSQRRRPRFKLGSQAPDDRASTSPE
jgi:hypothetical protein